jgi:hypothetical protein
VTQRGSASQSTVRSANEIGGDYYREPRLMAVTRNGSRARFQRAGRVGQHRGGSGGHRARVTRGRLGSWRSGWAPPVRRRHWWPWNRRRCARTHQGIADRLAERLGRQRRESGPRPDGWRR